MVLSIMLKYRTKMSKLSYFLIPCLFVFIMSCVSSEEIFDDNQAEIEQYLMENNLTSEVTSTGLHYVITTPGNFNYPTASDDVKVNYSGKYIDGWEFDSGVEAEFNLSNVIAGWTEGMQLISEGGSCILLIPASLGYGNSPPPSIRKNAVLIFEVDLLEIL